MESLNEPGLDENCRFVIWASQKRMWCDWKKVGFNLAHLTHYVGTPVLLKQADVEKISNSFGVHRENLEVYELVRIQT